MTKQLQSVRLKKFTEVAQKAANLLELLDNEVSWRQRLKEKDRITVAYIELEKAIDEVI